MLAEVMREIEQYRFSAELNLGAGTSAFRRGLREHDLFRRLLELAKTVGARSEIAARITDIASREIDTRYENRYDAALSAYLTVLGDTAEPDVVAKAATAVIKTPKCWWAVGIARELLLRATATGVLEAAPIGR